MTNLIPSAITSGMVIGLCAEIYSKVGGPIGAVLFGIGLVTICACKLPLFTGRVGSSNDIVALTTTLALNAFGVLFAVGVFYAPNWFTLVSLGVGCGALMQIGVVLYKKGMPYMTVLCVAAFLLAGFKHSVAIIYSGIDVVSFAQIVVGNVIGAKLLYYGGVR